VICQDVTDLGPRESRLRTGRLSDNPAQRLVDRRPSGRQPSGFDLKLPCQIFDGSRFAHLHLRCVLVHCGHDFWHVGTQRSVKEVNKEPQLGLSSPYDAVLFCKHDLRSEEKGVESL
jgi:hypothetical protein